jgi:hypothetical protein
MNLPNLTLKRSYFPHGTFGTLYDERGQIIARTAEKEWENNEPHVSCIPAGSYTVEPHNSPKWGRCFAIYAETLGVTIYGPSQRTHCLFHTANRPSELAGCIAPGNSFAVINGEWAVANSGKTMEMLRKQYPDGFTLDISKA